MNGVEWSVARMRNRHAGLLIVSSRVTNDGADVDMFQNPATRGGLLVFRVIVVVVLYYRVTLSRTRRSTCAPASLSLD